MTYSLRSKGLVGKAMGGIPVLLGQPQSVGGVRKKPVYGRKIGVGGGRRTRLGMVSNILVLKT